MFRSLLNFGTSGQPKVPSRQRVSMGNSSSQIPLDGASPKVKSDKRKHSPESIEVDDEGENSSDTLSKSTEPQSLDEFSHATKRRRLLSRSVSVLGAAERNGPVRITKERDSKHARDSAAGPLEVNDLGVAENIGAADRHPLDDIASDDEAIARTLETYRSGKKEGRGAGRSVAPERLSSVLNGAPAEIEAQPQGVVDTLPRHAVANENSVRRRKSPLKQQSQRPRSPKPPSIGSKQTNRWQQPTLDEKESPTDSGYSTGHVAGPEARGRELVGVFVPSVNVSSKSSNEAGAKKRKRAEPMQIQSSPPLVVNGEQDGNPDQASDREKVLFIRRKVKGKDKEVVTATPLTAQREGLAAVTMTTKAPRPRTDTRRNPVFDNSKFMARLREEQEREANMLSFRDAAYATTQLPKRASRVAASKKVSDCATAEAEAVKERLEAAKVLKRGNRKGAALDAIPLSTPSHIGGTPAVQYIPSDDSDRLARLSALLEKRWNGKADGQAHRSSQTRVAKQNKEPRQVNLAESAELLPPASSTPGRIPFRIDHEAITDPNGDLTLDKEVGIQANSLDRSRRETSNLSRSKIRQASTHEPTKSKSSSGPLINSVSLVNTITETLSSSANIAALGRPSDGQRDESDSSDTEDDSDSSPDSQSNDDSQDTQTTPRGHSDREAGDGLGGPSEGDKKRQKSKEETTSSSGSSTETSSDEESEQSERQEESLPPLETAQDADVDGHSRNGEQAEAITEADLGPTAQDDQTESDTEMRLVLRAPASSEEEPLETPREQAVNSVPRTAPAKARPRPSMAHSVRRRSAPSPSQSASQSRTALTPEELERLDLHKAAYCAEHDLSNQQFAEKIHQNANNNKALGVFWDQIIAAAGCHQARRIPFKKAVRRVYIPVQRRAWTAEEDAALAELYSSLGPQWRRIGDRLERLPEDARDRFRNHVKNVNRNEGAWSEKECKILRRTVGDCAALQVEAARKEARRNGERWRSWQPELRALVVWDVVSDKMGGIRNRLQCQEKMLLMVKRGDVNVKECVQAGLGRLWEKKMRERDNDDEDDEATIRVEEDGSEDGGEESDRR